MALFNNTAFSQLICKFSKIPILNVTREFHRYVAPTVRQINSRKKKAEPLSAEKLKRSNYIEWNYNSEIYAFGKRVGEDFKIELLLQAFIHRSFIIQEELKQQDVGIESSGLTMKDNELLIKKGGLLISNEINTFISHNFPKLPSECIQQIHNHLVADETLGDIAKSLGTSELILTSEYPAHIGTLARTLKAVVGALAESQTVEIANKFVVDFILTRLAERDINELYDIQNPLQLLTDILSKDSSDPPEPRIIGQSAMNEILASYTVGLYSDRRFIGKGDGETIEIAVEMAARDSLKRLFDTTDSSTPLKFSNVNSAPAIASL